MQEGGLESEQDDGEGKEKRKHVHNSRGNLVNFFFTNFPPDWNKASLHEVFVEVGEIADVYVARKVCKTGKRFGFARFFRCGNIRALENRLNRVKIGNFKLRANIVTFEKLSSNFNQGCKKVEWVFDISSKSSQVSTRNPSLSMNEILLQKASVGDSFIFHSVSELQSLWSSVNARDCKGTKLRGSKFSLDFIIKDGSNEMVSDEISNIVEVTLVRPRK